MPARDPQSLGFSLVEVMGGLILVTGGLLGLSVLLVSSQKNHQQTTHEYLVASTLSEVAESIRATPFREIQSYRDFELHIGQIQARGTVTVYLDETDSSPGARSFGLPRDLDGDGLVATQDITANYGLLPVKIEITWSNKDGPQSRSLLFYMTPVD
ncbi:MAG: hypothetical protein V3T77_06435 [Planctomycetota bacterium]